MTGKKIKLLTLVLILSFVFAPFLLTSRAQAAAEKVPEFQKLNELDGKRVAMLSGAPFAESVDKYVKNATYSYYDSFADILNALRVGKIDAALNNTAVAEFQANRSEEFAIIDQCIEEMEFGIAFKKGDPEQKKWAAGLEKLGKEEVERLWDMWVCGPDDQKILQEQDWPGKNGTVKVAILDNLEPMGYIGEDEKIVGFDPALLLSIAKVLDVKVEFIGMELAGLLPAVESEKVDFAIGSMLITKARLETMDMVPYHAGNVVLITRNAATKEEADGGILAGLKESFRKTFIDDNRYNMLLNGLATTMSIAIISGILGLLLGFCLIYLDRLNNPIINMIIKLIGEILVGLPAVVILLVMYFVIFGKIDIPAVFVAVIAFTIMFGMKCFSLIKNAIQSVDKGQMEAALSLGYKERKAFSRIVLPQAKNIYFPLISAQFVAMIKDTAIVGFIAVLDLTRAGDLIRSRTMEAFFPLITVAIIYFIMIKLMSILISFINDFAIKKMKEKRQREYGEIDMEEKISRGKEEN